MTTDPKPPTAPTAPSVPAPSAAEPPPPPAGEAGKPVVLTFWQHVFIWSMILLVGVIFGVGSTIGILQQGPSYVDARKDVTEADVSQRMRIAERLERHLNPYWFYGPQAWQFQAAGGYQEWAERIRYARVAEAEGYLPTGEPLDRLVRFFLGETGPGGRTYAAILTDLKGTKDEITRAELEHFLAERQAVAALFRRLAPIPASGSAVAEIIPAETFAIAEVELTAAHLLPAVADDDPDLQPAYERLKAERFATPARADLHIAFADIHALRSLAVKSLSDAELQAWYDAHPAEFSSPDPADPAKTVRKPFAEVRSQVVDRVTAERALPEAIKQVEAFNERIAGQDLAAKDAAAFAAAAAQAGLKTKVVSVDEPAPSGSMDLGELGTLADQAGFFNRANAVGLISNVLASEGDGREGRPLGTAMIIRLDARREPGHRPLAEVLAQVKAHVAGRRAWKEFMVQAEAARAAAQAKGLAAWAASDDAKAWSAKLANATAQPNRRIAAPPAEPDGPLGEERLLAELAMPERPVALDRVAAGAGADADLPRVKLVQVERIEPPAQAADPAMAANQYRRAVSSALGMSAQTRLRDRLEGR